MTELVRYEVSDRIARVSIDHGKANALSPEVLAGLAGALDRAEAAGPDAVGCLLVTGRPGMLTGGFDLSVMRESAAAAGQLVTDGGALLTRLYGSDVPVVVACGGHAIAAGALLLLAADERIGAEGAFRIGLIETRIGLVLPRWAAELAAERIGRAHLQLATVGALEYDPQGALAAGFLDSVVPPDELDDAAVAAARRWAELPRGAYVGQVRTNRGERLAALAAAVDADRGRAFTVDG